MLIGAMNHPASPVMDEIEWIAGLGLDFIDLTLEPPAAASWQVNVAAIRAALDRTGLQVVGHTAYYLPFASPYEEVRQGAVVELRRCLAVFGELGARWMNIHPDRNVPMHDRAFVIQRNLETLAEVLPDARRHGVGLMIENVPGEHNSASQLAELLGPLPELGLHLDIGHANLLAPSTNAIELIAAFGHRVRHVHLHDNRGGQADLHLPLGTGTVDVPGAVRALRATGYDGTITVEVFSADRYYLAYSCDKLRRLWEAALP